GLDPLGRHDLREVLLRLKRNGKTIFFSSHELTEVEDLCDRVIMINKGEIVTEAAVNDLMKPLNVFDVHFTCPGNLPSELNALNPTHNPDGSWLIEVTDQNIYANAIADLARTGCQILSTESR